MLRSPWDYVERLDEFLAWAEHVATVSALWNPTALVRWNTHKAYLLELAAAGAPVVPTVVLAAGERGRARRHRRRAGLERGRREARGRGRRPMARAASTSAIPRARRISTRSLPAGDVLVQQYAPAVTEAR